MARNDGHGSTKKLEELANVRAADGVLYMPHNPASAEILWQRLNEEKRKFDLNEGNQYVKLLQAIEKWLAEGREINEPHGRATADGGGRRKKSKKSKRRKSKRRKSKKRKTLRRY